MNDYQAYLIQPLSLKLIVFTTDETENIQANYYYYELGQGLVKILKVIDSSVMFINNNNYYEINHVYAFYS